MCRRCPMVIWIVTLLDRYSSAHFLSVDDPPADMLENTPRVESAMTPSTMYSPLMPLSRCFLHLIYLPIYVFPLYVNTCLRSRTSLHVAVLFFGNSNLPTLFICYQGSIEKLTLLGAIYYYYYYYYFQTIDCQNLYNLCGAYAQKVLLSENARAP
jgi:hypothetical protein